MPFDLAEWLNLALRWLHLTAGIAWIGSSFYFVWLDNHLKAPAEGDASGELWSVHGGGFYHNQKYQVAPSDDARRAALVQMGGLFHLDQRLFAAGADLLCRRAELPDRSGQGGAEPGRGDRHRPGGAGARLAGLRPAVPLAGGVEQPGARHLLVRLPAVRRHRCSTACSTRAPPICTSARSSAR